MESYKIWAVHVCLRGVLLLQPQSLEWVAETMQKDADGDEAHEFLGPY